MKTFLNGLLIAFNPQRGWQSIADNDAGWLALLLLHTAPYALIPAVCWYIGVTQVGWSFGGEIVKLLGNGSAYYAPATSAIAMAEAYLGDQKRILPSASFVEGKYGLEGLYVGVPTVIGSGGTEDVIEIELTDEEKANLKVSTDAVEELLEACKALDSSLA